MYYYSPLASIHQAIACPIAHPRAALCQTNTPYMHIIFVCTPSSTLALIHSRDPPYMHPDPAVSPVKYEPK